MTSNCSVLTFKMVACPKPENQFRDLNPADVDEMVLCGSCWLPADTNTTRLSSDGPTSGEGGRLNVATGTLFCAQLQLH